VIVIDSFAFVAILLKEAERDTFIATIAADDRRIVSALTVLESHLGGPQGRPGDSLLPHGEALNLEELPPHGFTVACFPHKVKGGSGGWTRAVALLD
jgi:hypothetical protein